VHKFVVAILTVKRFWKFRKSQLTYKAHLAPSCWPSAADTVPVARWYRIRKLVPRMY
jgi:hypothetical protein